MNTREYRNRMGFHAEEEMIGKRPSEYLTHDLAKHYEADDQKVINAGQPLRNIIEIGFNEQGLPDWIFTDKYPLRDVDRKVVGIVGTMHSFAGQMRSLPHMGVVGKAADFINAFRRILVMPPRAYRADHLTSLTSSA